MRNEKIRRNRIRLFAIIGLIFIVWLIIRLTIGIKQNKNAFEEDLPLTYSMSLDDSSLFAGNVRNKFEVVEIRNSKVRPPISILLYDKKYHLVTYKIPTANTIYPLSKLLQVSNKGNSTSTGYSYSLIGKDIIYQIKYIAGKPEPAQQIYLTLSGNSIQTVVSTDSIISYNLKCRNLSIKYDNKAPVDMFVTGKKRPLGITTIIPMDILFLKREGFIYFMMMTPQSNETNIPANLLYNIVTNNSQ
jgi:hypothetical protein